MSNILISKGIKLNLDFSFVAGDPFVENGRLGLIKFAGKTNFKDKDELKAIIEKILKLYTKIWEKNKLSSYWLHGANKKSSDDTLKIIDKILNDEPKTGNICVCCGKNKTICLGDRTILPLGFSATNSNFSSSFQETMICQNCYISLFALPLNTIKVDKQLLFIRSSDKINSYWAGKNIDKIKKMFILSPNESLIVSEVNYIHNFIYIFLENLIQDIPNSIDSDVVFYHFSNFGASPDINIYHIYTDLISFMQDISPKQFQGYISGNRDILNVWNGILRYNFCSLKIEGEELYFKDRKEVKRLSFDDAKKLYRNTLISNFINGKDITSMILKKFRVDMTNEKNRAVLKDLTKAYRGLLFKYLIKVRHMNKERLDFLKEVATKMATLQNAKKRLGELGRQRSLNSFRTLLVHMFKDYAKENSNELLFNVDDFVLKILPTDSYFAQTRDILFVAIFEQMINNLTKEEIDDMNIVEGEDEDE